MVVGVAAACGGGGGGVVMPGARLITEDYCWADMSPGGTGGSERPAAFDRPMPCIIGTEFFQQGDCWSDGADVNVPPTAVPAPGAESDSLQYVTDCATPHQYQVFAVIPVGEAEYPDLDARIKQCGNLFEDRFAGSSDYNFLAHGSSLNALTAGRGQIVCSVFRSDRTLLTTAVV